MLTEEGRTAVNRLVSARRAGLARLLEGWAPEEHDELVGLLHRRAQELVHDDSPSSGRRAGWRQVLLDED